MGPYTKIPQLYVATNLVKGRWALAGFSLQKIGPDTLFLPHTVWSALLCFRVSGPAALVLLRRRVSLKRDVRKWKPE
jgi:hypothetical protein